MKILLKIAYLGTPYAGFQVQPNAVTVQSALQDGVEKVFGARYPLTGCSRTDSGVHANAFYCTVDTDEACSTLCAHPDRIPDALNAVLPDSITVWRAWIMADDFHPRYDAKGKEYAYLIWNDRPKNPFLTDRAYHYKRPLDIERMAKAASQLIGRHDFAAFMASGSKITDTVRCISDCRVEKEGQTVKIIVSADGFLYNMVRIIAGTLIAVSEGKIAPDEMEQILLSKDRSRAGSTAPACGLYLNRVFYPKEVFGQETVGKESEDGTSR